MRSVTYWFLWIFVFTVPWDVVALPGVGTLARLAGTLSIAFAVLTTIVEGRVRKPNAIILFAAAFAASSALTLLWTMSYPSTIQRVWTYAQLFASVWVVQTFVRTRAQMQSLLVAFCLGAFVPMASLLSVFVSGVSGNISMENRFSSEGAVRLNANDLALTLVLGMPMAWYLVIHGKGKFRLVAAGFFALVPLSVLLTGTRAAFLAGLVALLIVPLTVPLQRLRSLMLVGVALFAVMATTAFFVPQPIWARMLTIWEEVGGGGDLTGRVQIWNAGLQVFPEHPLLGVGAGAYGSAVAPVVVTHQDTVSHNVPLSVLIEQGIVGLSIFAALLAACAHTIFGLPAPERKLWAVVMLAWLTGVMSLNWEHRKVTWLLFGLLAAQSLSRGASSWTPHSKVWSATQLRAGGRSRSCAITYLRKDVVRELPR